MEDLNRLKVVLAEQKPTGKWLTEQLGKMIQPFLNNVQIKCHYR